MTRGDIVIVGGRPAVVVQSQALAALPRVLVVPTSTDAPPAPWRPVVSINGTPTRLLTDLTTSIDAELLTTPAGSLSPEELVTIDRSLRLVLDI